MQAQKREYENNRATTLSNEEFVIIAKSFSRRILEERAAEFDGKLNLDGEFDWGEPVGREAW